MAVKFIVASLVLTFFLASAAQVASLTVSSSGIIVGRTVTVSSRRRWESSSSSSSSSSDSSSSRRRWVSSYTRRRIVEFGGDGRGVGATRDQTQMRPEFVKSFKCSGMGPDDCTECSDQDTCWRGYNNLGHERIDAPANSGFSHYMMEVLIKCDDDEANLMFKSTVLNNAKLFVYKDGNLLQTLTSTQTSSAQIPGTEGQMKGRVRIYLEINDASHDATAQIELMAKGTADDVTQCLDVKECLSVFGDGSRAAFELRNRNRLQLACLSPGAVDEPLNPQEQAKCTEWLNCMEDHADSLEALKAVLKISLSSSGSLQEIGGGLQEIAINTAGSLHKVDGASPHEAGLMAAGHSKSKEDWCLDPAVDDPESLQCDCLDVALATCTNGEAKEDCLRRYMCGHSGVCQNWRDNPENCPAQMLQQKQKKQERLNDESKTWTKAVMLRSAGGDKSSEHLDGTLSDKCTE